MKIKAPGPGLVICQGGGIYMALASYYTHHIQVKVINQTGSTLAAHTHTHTYI